MVLGCQVFPSVLNHRLLHEADGHTSKIHQYGHNNKLQRYRQTFSPWFLCCIFFHHSPMVVFTFATKDYSFTPGWDQLWTRPLQAATMTSGDTDPVLSREQLKPRKGSCRHQPCHQELSQGRELWRNCFTTGSLLRYFGMFLLFHHGLSWLERPLGLYSHF